MLRELKVDVLNRFLLSCFLLIAIWHDFLSKNHQFCPEITPSEFLCKNQYDLLRMQGMHFSRFILQNQQKQEDLREDLARNLFLLHIHTKNASKPLFLEILILLQHKKYLQSTLINQFFEFSDPKLGLLRLSSIFKKFWVAISKKS